MAGFHVITVPLILTNLLCLTSNVFGQGTEQLKISYTMPEESPWNTRLGNIISDASLRSKYSSSAIVDSFKFGMLKGRYKDNFQVNTNTGDFSSATPIDRESICPGKDNCQVQVDVAIISPGDYFRVINIFIEILDINDKTPTFPQEKWVIDISESTQPGAAYGIPQAIDQDSSQYSIKSYALDLVGDEFELSVTFNDDQTQDLKLVLNRKLDREDVASYKSILRATDGDMITPRTGTMQLVVNVIDHNDNNPVFDKDTYNITVAENYPPDMVIVTLHATDLDDGQNGQIRYQLSTQTSTLYGHLFQIDQYTGELSLKSELDYEQQDIYTLQVQANDLGLGSLPAIAKVIITVQDVNDHKPAITVSGLSTSGNVEISENANFGDPVAHISVEDLDKGISGEYTCKSMDSSMVLESLYMDTYKLVSQRIFDYETEQTYDVTIQCSDKGTPQLTSAVQIKIAIIDENDNPPVFIQPNYAIKMNENNSIGAEVLRVSASDRDSGNNGRITYQLSENVKQDLEIDGYGIIRAKKSLDHEQMSVLRFTVTAYDGGSPRLTTSVPVSITLNDINDESPRFIDKSYSFGSFENQPVGTEVGTVFAEDPDSPPFNDFMFSLDMYYNGHDSFDIDARSGKITIKKTLDREQFHTHLLKVWAVNTASPQLSSFVNVTVHVADKNDNAPLIYFPSKINRTVQVPANAVKGYIFTMIQATDSDQSDNARLRYSIAGGNSENLFDMDDMTGAISVKKDLSQAEETEYEVIIVVEDHGDDPKKAVAVLHVVINSTLSMNPLMVPVSTRVPLQQDSDPIISADHQKILICLGVVTTILVIILVSAIICIKRRQMQQERNMIQNVYKVEVCPTHDGEEQAPLGDISTDLKIKMDDQSSFNDSGCVEGGKTHLTLEDLKRMKCLYRDRPDITQHVPTVRRPASPLAVHRAGSPMGRPQSPLIQSPSYSMRVPGQPDAPYDGILDLLQRQPSIQAADNESTGSNTDSGRGTSEPAHDVSTGSGNHRGSADDFSSRHGNHVPAHMYLKEKNGYSTNIRNHPRVPQPSYSDASQKPTHYTFQSPPPQTNHKPKHNNGEKSVHFQSPVVNNKFSYNRNGISSPVDIKKGGRPTSDDVSESCDNISLASTTSGEYIIQMDQNGGPFQSVNV